MESVKDYMDKKAVAQVLEQIAAFLELKSENPFRIRAFRTAARALVGFPGDLRRSLEDGTLAAMARIVRDLTARQKQSRLNDSEERALNRFTDRLLSEWAACFGIKLEEARKRLRTILQKL